MTLEVFLIVLGGIQAEFFFFRGNPHWLKEVYQFEDNIRHYKAKPTAISIPFTCVHMKAVLPSQRPSAPAPFTDFVAKTPVNNIPTIPPTPWQGNTSRVSSRVDFCL